LISGVYENDDQERLLMETAEIGQVKN